MLIADVLCDIHTSLQQVGIPNLVYLGVNPAILNRLWGIIIELTYITLTEFLCNDLLISSIVHYIVAHFWARYPGSLL